MQEEILDERREHVPRLQMHDGTDEVQPVSCYKGDDDIAEGSVSLYEAIRHESEMIAS